MHRKFIAENLSHSFDNVIARVKEIFFLLFVFKTEIWLASGEFVYIKKAIVYLIDQLYFLFKLNLAL